MSTERPAAPSDVSFALAVLERMIERGCNTGLAALRRAAESDQMHGGA